jgi:hypothetical protein
VSSDTLTLRFHHVPVVVIGDAEHLDAFRSLVVEDATQHAVHEPENAITIRLRGSRVLDAALPRGIHATGDRQVHVVDDDAHAVLDLSSHTIDVFGEMSGTILPRSAMGRTLALVLSLALRERGIIALHAAAVLTYERALVVVGDSGAGKTTTALALMEAGCVPMTDDRLFLRPTGEVWELFSAPEEFRVTTTTLHAFPGREHQRGALVEAFDKYELDVAKFGKLITRYSGSVQLLFARQRSTSTTELAPMTRAEALGELMVASPLVAVGDATRTREHARVLSALARSNVAWLELGRDLLEDPARAARAILSSLPALS